jgi:hypothetical protein
LEGFKQYIKEKKLLTATLKDIPVNTVVKDGIIDYFGNHLVPYIGKKIQVKPILHYKNWYGFHINTPTLASHEYIHKSWLIFDDQEQELELDI